MENLSSRVTKNMRKPMKSMSNDERAVKVANTLLALDHAIELLTAASEKAFQTLGRRHDAAKALESANERARVARAKLEIARKAIP